jgi:hypothetical protein
MGLFGPQREPTIPLQGRERYVRLRLAREKSRPNRNTPSASSKLADASAAARAVDGNDRRRGPKSPIPGPATRLANEVRSTYNSEARKPKGSHRTY